MAGRVEFANALRGIAALSVMASHYFVSFFYNQALVTTLANVALPLDQIPVPVASQIVVSIPINLAAFGVSLFFLISGFVIPFSFERASAGGFLLGRFFRIYPLYAAGFCVTVLALWTASAVFGKPFPYSLRHVFAASVPGGREMFGLPSIDAIVWTLEIELKFYLLCALCSTWLRRGSLLVFLLPLVLGGLAVAMSAVGPMVYAVWLAAPFVALMFAGVAFNFYFRRAIGLVALAALVAGCFAIFAVLAIKLQGLPKDYVLSTGAALAVFGASAALAPFWRPVRPLSFLADISYPLYVIHGVAGYVLMAILIHLGATPTVALVVTIISAIGVSWVLHVGIEVPSHRFGRALSQRASG